MDSLIKYQMAKEKSKFNCYFQVLGVGTSHMTLQRISWRSVQNRQLYYFCPPKKNTTFANANIRDCDQYFGVRKYSYTLIYIYTLYLLYSTYNFTHVVHSFLNISTLNNEYIICTNQGRSQKFKLGGAKFKLKKHITTLGTQHNTTINKLY